MKPSKRDENPSGLYEIAECGLARNRYQVPRGAQATIDSVSTEQTTDGIPERERERPRGKVDAIFDLREAVERKVRVEIEVERTQSPDAKDELLDATLDVESKTQDAIDVCHECDRPHSSDEPHERRARIGRASDNVIEVDFRRIGDVDPA